MDELTRIPDPDFARLPDDYGEDEEFTNPRAALILRYLEATRQLDTGTIGARRYEADEIESMKKQLERCGIRGVSVASEADFQERTSKRPL